MKSMYCNFSEQTTTKIGRNLQTVK